jgi:hypothetical protein
MWAADTGMRMQVFQLAAHFDHFTSGPWPQQQSKKIRDLKMVALKLPREFISHPVMKQVNSPLVAFQVCRFDLNYRHSFACKRLFYGPTEAGRWLHVQVFNSLN